MKFIRGTPVVIDNRWVVPYSPYLLNKIQCHVNIGYCQTIALIKYLFLCHFKGVDIITSKGLDSADEIRKFVTGQNLSSCYFFWYLREFEMVDIVPSVHHLQLSL